MFTSEFWHMFSIFDANSNYSSWWLINVIGLKSQLGFIEIIAAATLALLQIIWEQNYTGKPHTNATYNLSFDPYATEIQIPNEFESAFE